MERLFKIGDLVIERRWLEMVKTEAQMNPQRGLRGEIGCPPLMTVEVTVDDECPGGVQHHYVCRSFRMGANGGPADFPIKYNEVELQAWNQEEWLIWWRGTMEPLRQAERERQEAAVRLRIEEIEKLQAELKAKAKD